MGGAPKARRRKLQAQRLRAAGASQVCWRLAAQAHRRRASALRADFCESCHVLSAARWLCGYAFTCAYVSTQWELPRFHRHRSGHSLSCAPVSLPERPGTGAGRKTPSGRAEKREAGEPYSHRFDALAHVNAYSQSQRAALSTWQDSQKSARSAKARLRCACAASLQHTCDAPAARKRCACNFLRRAFGAPPISTFTALRFTYPNLAPRLALKIRACLHAPFAPPYHHLRSLKNTIAAPCPGCDKYLERGMVMPRQTTFRRPPINGNQTDLLQAMGGQFRNPPKGVIRNAPCQHQGAIARTKMQTHPP